MSIYIVTVSTLSVPVCFKCEYYQLQPSCYLTHYTKLSLLWLPGMCHPFRFIPN